MTRLGDFLEKRAIKKAEIARRTGISPHRISEITINDTAILRADEVYLIAKAIQADPCELLEYVCGHLALPSLQ